MAEAQAKMVPGRLARLGRVLRRLGVAVIVILALLAGLRWLLFEGPILPPEDLPSGAIIDVHTHVAGLGLHGSGCAVSPHLKDSYKFSIYLRAFSTDREELARDGDAVVAERLATKLRASTRVSQSVVLALDGFVDAAGDLDLERTEVMVPNEFVARETAHHEELLFGCSVHPNRKDAVDQLRRWKAEGAVLVKWLPSIQGIDPADPRHAAYYDACVELGLPILTHTGDEHSFTRADNGLADPLKLRAPLERGVTVIAAHVATIGETDGQDNFDRLLGLVDEFPNLYADISSLTQINKLGHLARVLREPRWLDRLVYGSDYPLTETPLVSPYLFPLNLTLQNMWELARIENVFDRDVALKRALGVPAAVFERTARLLGVGGE